MAKLMCTLLIALGLTGVAAFGQNVDQKSKTKIVVEDGKEITVTGCVARGAGRGFILTHAANKDGALGSYALVADEDDDDEIEEVEEHLGHRVEVKGRAADQGSGKVKIHTKSEVETGVGDTRKRESKTEVEGDLQGLPFLGVKSIRTLATICP